MSVRTCRAELWTAGARCARIIVACGVVCGAAWGLLGASGCRATVGDAVGGEADAKPDAVVVDAPPDAAVDAPPPDAPPALLSCVESYGAAPGFLLCAEDATRCAFNAMTGGGTCNELCGELGGSCEAAFDNVADPGLECTPVEGSTDTCDTPRNTEICVCSRLSAPQ